MKVGSILTLLFVVCSFCFPDIVYSVSLNKCLTNYGAVATLLCSCKADTNLRGNEIGTQVMNTKKMNKKMRMMKRDNCAKKSICPKNLDGFNYIRCNNFDYDGYYGQGEGVKCVYDYEGPGCACPEDEKVNGYWFKRRECNVNKVICSYLPDDIDDQNTFKLCEEYCPEHSDSGFRLVKGCMDSTDDMDREYITCVYSGRSGEQCLSCPTDDEISNDYEFTSKYMVNHNDKRCKFSCKYVDSNSL